VFNLQGSEIIVILLLALVVLGPEKLPDAVRRFMQTYNELRKMGQGFQSELKSALDEPMRELRDTANLIKENADPNRLFEEASAEQRLEGTDPVDDADPPAAAPPAAAPPADGDDALAAVDDDGPRGVLDPGSATIGIPPVRPAGTVQPIRQVERLDDEAESA
jgi:sec-independent protein translocase protein TatB